MDDTRFSTCETTINEDMLTEIFPWMLKSSELKASSVLLHFKFLYYIHNSYTHLQDMILFEAIVFCITSKYEIQK